MNLSRSVSHRAVVLLLMLSFVLVPPAQFQTRLYKKDKPKDYKGKSEEYGDGEAYKNKPPGCDPREWVEFEPMRDRRVRILKTNSVLVARLDKLLSSRGQERKERVEAYVSTAITDENGVLLVPRNSKVIGQIERIHPATKDRPAMMEVAFNTLRRCIYRNELRPDSELNGDCYYDQVQLGGIMIGLAGNMCRNFNDDDAVIEGRKPVSNTKEKVKLASAGAGGGALLAGLAVGTLTATGIGAGLGLGLGLMLARGGKKPGGEVYLEAGTLFGVQLTHPLPLRFLDQRLNYSAPRRDTEPPRDNRPTPVLTERERNYLNQIDSNVERVYTMHRAYLDEFDQTPRSDSMRVLERVRVSVKTVWQITQRPVPVSTKKIALQKAVANLYDVVAVADNTIKAERAQSGGLQPGSFARWGRIIEPLNLLAESQRVN